MDVLARAASLREAGRPFALATVTWRRAPSSGTQGARAIIHTDGRVEGWMGGACSQPTIVREALEALGDGRPRILVLGEPDDREGVTTVAMACSSEGAMEVFVEPVLVAPHVHVIGSSPMTEVLSRLAGVLGWRVSTADQASTAGVGPGSFVVVATQGHYDEPALEVALQTDAGYIGLVASAKRGSEVLSYLRERGVSEEQLSRIHCPAGLDLGHIEHEEIAVSILAELVARRATAPPAPASEVHMPDQAIDPVCEMTVDVGSARWTSDIGGTTYYFCAPGCKKAFDRDPAAFA